MSNEHEMDDGAIRRRQRQARRDRQKRKQRIALFLYFLLGLSMVIGMIALLFFGDLSDLAGY
ncbi:MAG: hypothetical protein HOM25_10225 [Rhodospirillaceae bacterium]|jgi:cell division septal protein FtsQ|nr:hypothetical protein [Rhodospirillaceae bacterium]MBT5810545.1 hypothetical protein [Rhodospirillaceae bacterium]